MPHSMVTHAVTQMFALQSLLFEDAIDESDALPKLYDVEYWHTLVPESSTDSDELRIALLSRVKEDNDNNVASASTLTPSSSVLSDDNAAVRVCCYVRRDIAFYHRQYCRIKAV